MCKTTEPNPLQIYMLTLGKCSTCICQTKKRMITERIFEKNACTLRAQVVPVKIYAMADVLLNRVLYILEFRNIQHLVAL